MFIIRSIFIKNFNQKNMSNINLTVLGVITGVKRVNDEKVLVTVTICDAKGELTDKSYNIPQEPCDEFVVGALISINLQQPLTILNQTSENDIEAMAIHEQEPDDKMCITIHGIVLEVLEQTDDQSKITVAVNICDGKIVNLPFVFRIATGSAEVGDTICATLPVAEDEDSDMLVNDFMLCRQPGDNAPVPEPDPAPGDGTDNQPAQ